MKKLKHHLYNLIAPILVALLVAGGTNAAFWQWSTTAGNNATADPTINWAEGMSPSSVNDSARAMMAAMAVWNKDNGGTALQSAGTSSALTLTTNTGYPSIAALDNQPITFTAGTTNIKAATLSIDGTTPQVLVFTDPNGTTTIPAATLVPGGIYTVTYSGGGYRLHSSYNNPFNIPLGMLSPYTGTVVPNANFVFAAGQCLSTTTYATYWALIGSPASGSCSGGQFRIIDMSGSVPAGLDTMPGFSAANRLTSSGTGCGTSMTTVGARCANESQSTSLSIGNLPSITSTNASVSFSASVSANNWVASSVTDSTAVNPPAGGGGSGIAASLTGGLVSKIVSTGTASGSVSVSSSGTSNTAIPRVMPVAGVTYILRVL